MVKGVKTRKGFTIVELVIAMAFVSILLVMIGALTLKIISIYQKGLSIKAVDTIGSNIISDVSNKILSSPNNPAKIICKKYITSQEESVKKCEENKAFKYTFYQAYGSLTSIDGENPKGDNKLVPTYGTFCTGKYSYLWNSGYLLNSKKYSLAGAPSPAKLLIKKSDENTITEINNSRLIRVIDISQELCAQNVNNDYEYMPVGSSKFYILNVPSGFDPETTDLISETDENLAIYDFRVFPKISHDLTRQGLYSGTFILATMRGGVDITGNGDYCIKPSDSLATDFNYCAINKFNFAVRSAGDLTVEERAGRRF